MSEEVKAAIRRLGQAVDREELERLKASLQDARLETLLECAEMAIEEYGHCVEIAIHLAGEGRRPESVSYHRQSYACTQIVGMIMERAQDSYDRSGADAAPQPRRRGGIGTPRAAGEGGVVKTSITELFSDESEGTS